MLPSDQIDEVNPAQPSGELRYNHFSVVHLQIFDLGDLDLTCLEDEDYFDATPDPIDRELFHMKNSSENPVARYKLSFRDKDGNVKKGFDYRISLNDPKVTLRGTMFIEISVFFRRTASVSYRLVIDGIDGFSKDGTDDGTDFTGITELSTDHLIMLASLKIGAEHWQYEKIEGETSPRAITDRQDIVIESYLGDKCDWLARPETTGFGRGETPPVYKKQRVRYTQRKVQKVHTQKKRRSQRKGG